MAFAGPDVIEASKRTAVQEMALLIGWDDFLNGGNLTDTIIIFHQPFNSYIPQLSHKFSQFQPSASPIWVRGLPLGASRQACPLLLS